MFERRCDGGLGSTNEIIIRQVELSECFAEPSGILVSLFQRRPARFFGRPLHFQAMLIGARQEKHLVAEQAMPTSYSVNVESRIGVSHVGSVIDIEDRSCSIKAVHRARLGGAAAAPVCIPPKPQIALGCMLSGDRLEVKHLRPNSDSTRRRQPKPSGRFGSNSVHRVQYFRLHHCTNATDASRQPIHMWRPGCPRCASFRSGLRSSNTKTACEPQAALIAVGSSQKK